MPTIQETLEKLGFTLNETKTYLSLLNLGSCLASDLAKKTELHRRPIYDALNRLIEKGLVSYTIKSGKKYFQASSPEKILDILKEREQEIKDLMPDLKEKFEKIKPNFKAEVYEGKEGMKTVLELILKEKKECLSMGSTGKGLLTLPYFIPQWQKRREKLKIIYRVLMEDTELNRKRAIDYKKMKYTAHRFLPKEIKNPQTMWVFGNYVALIIVSLDYPIVFLIENKEIADSYRNYFNFMWKKV